MLPSATRCSALAFEIAGRLLEANSVQVAPPSVEYHQLPCVVSAVVMTMPGVDGPVEGPSGSVTLFGPVPLPTRVEARKPAAVPFTGAPRLSSVWCGIVRLTSASTGESLAFATVTVASVPLITDVSVPVALKVTVRVPVFGVSLAS